MTPSIRPATLGDAAAIAAIYNYYVRDTVVTFEEEPVADTEMARRMRETTATLPWLVLEEGSRIAGYAYATKWKTRAAYRHAVESTVYLDPAVTGRGFGSLLYQRLLDELRSRRLHCVIGGIALPNAASERLHEKAGFKKVAHFEQVGFKFGRWINVGYWERFLGEGPATSAGPT